MSKLQDTVRFRNLTLGRLQSINKQINNILCSLPESSSMDDIEKEELLRIKYTLYDTIAMWKYRTKIISIEMKNKES